MRVAVTGGTTRGASPSTQTVGSADGAGRSFFASSAFDSTHSVAPAASSTRTPASPAAPSGTTTR